MLASEQHPLDNDNGIIDQHAEGNNQRAQRDTLQLNAAQVHNQQRAKHIKRQRKRNDNAAAHAHKNQQHADHNRQRHQEIGNKAIDRMRHFRRLIIKHVQLNARRFFRRHMLQPGFQRFAHINNVDAGDKRHAHGYRLASVVVINAGR